MIIYKLIDDDVRNDIISKNAISLTRPLLNFGPPEGLVLEFFRDIMKLTKECDGYSNITPTKDILSKIKNWYEGYYYSLGDDSYSLCDIYTDLQIIMTIYFQTYCGYFTKQNLFDKKTLDKYLKDNKCFATKFNKKYILKTVINVEENNVYSKEWELKKNDKNNVPSEYKFFDEKNPSPFNNNIIAYVNATRVEYMPNDFSFCDLFDIFNTIDKRKISTFFKYLDADYSSQQEIRLITYLPSYRYNSITTACPNLFIFNEEEQLETKLFYYAVSVYDYIKRNFPERIYLDIEGKYEIKDIDSIL